MKPIHGHAGNGKKKKQSRAYRCWINMRSRCSSPTSQAYQDYGGRGIAVCKRWSAFANFLEDMGEPTHNQTIDRIDNNGNYQPDNCRWIDYQGQNRNRRSNRLLTANGETKTIVEWSEQTGIKFCTIWRRLKNGWSESDAVSIPFRRWTPCASR